MERQDRIPGKIKENELRALFFMENSLIDNAEKILIKNIKRHTSSTLTYDLLIKIYDANQNLSSLVDVLNLGIKNTDKSNFYRKLKKQVIISHIFSDMQSV